MTQVAVCGSFDDLRSPQMRFLHEASRQGDLHVRLWSDEAIRASTGKPPKFPQAERLYLLQSIRYVKAVELVERTGRDGLPEGRGPRPDLWLDMAADLSPERQQACAARGIGYRLLGPPDLRGFPLLPESEPAPGRKKVIVTGCYDWFHSGHVRFFEEAAEHGDLYVALGHDANIRLLKGEGHPLFPEQERRYMVQAIRFVKQALVSSGHGWMDAEPEVRRLKPDRYVVNEDGDKPEKREFCASHGLEYVVLKRAPKPGLPRRQSTDLRGF